MAFCSCWAWDEESPSWEPAAYAPCRHYVSRYYLVVYGYRQCQGGYRTYVGGGIAEGILGDGGRGVGAVGQDGWRDGVEGVNFALICISRYVLASGWDPPYLVAANLEDLWLCLTEVHDIGNEVRDGISIRVVAFVPIVWNAI